MERLKLVVILLIVLTGVQSKQRGQRARRFRRKLTTDLSRRWQSPILYKVSYGVTKSSVEAGIRMWEKETCVRFKEIKDTADNHYVNFVSDGWKCYSSVGKQESNRQLISIGVGCGRAGVVAHEIGHTLGFWHEHARPDRDKYINVLPENLRHSNRMSNFVKWTSKEVTTDLPYDLGSVMHYDGDSFSLPGKQTIRTKESTYQDTIGQRYELSFIDVKTINQAYCNDRCTKALNCVNGGYEDPLDCAKCRCPPGFAGKRCDGVRAQDAVCGNARIAPSKYWKTINSAGDIDCNWLIEAPEGDHVEVAVKKLTFDCVTPCNKAHLEIRYHSMDATGARICCNQHPHPIIRSETNKVLIQYHGLPFTGFRLEYRLAPTAKPASWSEWSACSHSCGSCGTQIKSRCLGDKCRKTEKHRRPCGTAPCPVLKNCEGLSCQPCCIPYEEQKGKCVLPYL